MNVKSIPLIALVVLVCSPAAALQADVLFDNGPFSGPQSNTRNTAETGFSQRLFDDFTLVNDSEITGFEWLQHDRNDLEYLNTEIRIYAGLPIAANLVFETNVIATRTPNATGTLFENWDGFDYEVTGLSIPLPAGTYFLGLNTNSGIGDTSWDETVGNASTIPGRYLVNINFPEPGLFLGSQDSVFKVIGNDFTEIFVDIKFCSDPNAFNCRKNGVLPVTVFGTEDFDVTAIDPDSLRLCLEDESACTGAPRNYYEADRGDPTQDIGTGACTSEEGPDLAHPDGFLDLDARFEATEVQAMLESFCGMPKGTVSPPLILTGSTYDGRLIRSVPFPDVGIDQLLKVDK